ncbi:MAG: DUF308 domain-containing protein [Oscillospiraceae bacterium]|nr:DUF308 domain-containing protein [Oscillospiraceae bacterium]
MKKALYWLWLILSVLMIPAGILAVANPAATLTSLAWVIGLLMLLEGAVTIAVYVYTRETLLSSGWVLFDGILTVVLSVFLLFNNIFTVQALPYAFGMWILVSSLQKAIYSFDLRRIGVPGWGWLLALGIAGAAFGVLSFVDPVFGSVAISVLVGWFLIFYGVSSVVLWSRVERARSFVKKTGKVLREGDPIEIDIR